MCDNLKERQEPKVHRTMGNRENGKRELKVGEWDGEKKGNMKCLDRG